GRRINIETTEAAIAVRIEVERELVRREPRALVVRRRVDGERTDGYERERVAKIRVWVAPRNGSIQRSIDRGVQWIAARFHTVVRARVDLGVAFIRELVVLNPKDPVAADEHRDANEDR